MTTKTLAEMRYLPKPTLRLDSPLLRERLLDEETKSFYLIREGHDPSGFTFLVLQWCSRPAEKPMWSPENEVSVIAYGEAEYDGIRHIWFGHESTENQGYLYYPDMEQLGLVFRWLRSMEIAYCMESGVMR